MRRMAKVAKLISPHTKLASTNRASHSPRMKRYPRFILLVGLVLIIYRLAFAEEGVSVWLQDSYSEALGDSPASSSGGPGLPDWVVQYVRWHQTVRNQFPGTSLFTDPKAPKLLVRTCTMDYECGGVHDRLGSLDWDLYLANQTKRVLLIWWEYPLLEEYLVPPCHYFQKTPGLCLDWTVPTEVQRNLSARRPPKFFEDILADWNQKKKLWPKRIGWAIARANNVTDSYGKNKILQHSLSAHIHQAELREKLGNETVPYDKLFRLFFRPSPGVQQEIDTVSMEAGLAPGQYTAIHLRVRYPTGVTKKDQSIILAGKPSGDNKTRTSNAADHQGLLWSGPSKEYAVGWATHAIECSQRFLLQNKGQNEKIYMISDSNDLVNYFVHEIRNTKDQKHLETLPPFELSAINVANSVNLVSRDSAMENFHLDRQQGRNVSEYYSTFVDLLLASQARCIAYGLGRYGLFASKIGGISCQVWYQAEAYNRASGKGDNNVPFCERN